MSKSNAIGRRNPAAIVAAGARGRLGKVRRPVPFVAPLPGSVRVLGRLGFRAALAAASRRVFAGGRGWSPKVKFEIFRCLFFTIFPSLIFGSVHQRRCFCDESRKVSFCFERVIFLHHSRVLSLSKRWHQFCKTNAYFQVLGMNVHA